MVGCLSMPPRPRPCNRRRVSAFCMALRATFLHPLTPGMFPRTLRATSLQPLTPARLLHVIASQCIGPRKGAPFVGRGAPRERCPALAFGRSWAWRTLGRRGAAIRIPAVTQDNEQYLRRIHNRLRICPGRTLLQTLTPYKFLHVIARSGATWQSVLFAAQHNGK